MNWAALFVVTGLSTLFMCIQYIANQRQFDFNHEAPLEHPINQPRPGPAPTASNDQQGTRSSSLNRHRGVDMTMDARSPDDDYSPSFLINRSRPPAAAATPSGGSHDPNTEEPFFHQQDTGTDCTGRRQPSAATTQPSETDYLPLGGATYCNSDQSMYCGGGRQNLNSIRRRAHSSSSVPCRSTGESSGTHSFEYDTQSTGSEVNAMNPSGAGGRCSGDAVEIVTAPCDDDQTPGEAAAVGEDGEDCEPRGRPCSSRRVRCERAGVEMSRLVDYIVRVLAVLLVLLLIIQFIIRVWRNYFGGGDDDEGFCSGPSNPCPFWGSIKSTLGYENGCQPYWGGCKKR